MAGGKLPEPGIKPRRSISSAGGRMRMPGQRSQARGASKHAYVISPGIHLLDQSHELVSEVA